MFQRIVKDPLTHFLLVGFVIFMLLDYGTGGSSDDNRIEVNQQRLQSMLQAQLRISDSKLVDQQWQRMSDDDKNILLQRYIEQEVLFREARNLGLDKNDSVIRSHLINKIRFLLGDLASATLAPNIKDVKQYFEENKRDYIQVPTLSFSHVFFKSNNNDWSQSDQKIERLLEQLQSKQLPLSDMLSQGDIFPYHKNYSAKTQQFLSSHFGRAFANQIFHESLTIGQWFGPRRSAFGSHALFITGKQGESLPEFESIQAVVSSDYKRSLLQQRTQQEIDALIANYKIIVE